MVRALLVLSLTFTIASETRAQAPPEPVVVASKPFGESYFLAELFAQVLESHGIAVDRRPGLGATQIAFGALRTNAIDVYPEYTGTGLLVILRDSLTTEMRIDPRATFAHVLRESARRFGVRWLPPLGFQNGYAIAVRRETATQFGLRTLSDLARSGDALVAGLTSDFLGRPDVVAALSLLSGRLDERRMREYNRRIEVDGEPIPAVAAAALHDLGLAQPDVATAGEPDVLRRSRVGNTGRPAGDGLLAFLWSRRAETLRLALRHLHLVGVALLAATLVAIPLGVGLERTRQSAEWIVGALGMLQTIPSIALLAFIIPLLGVGVTPALVALWLYALYPIARNTYTGVRDADPEAVEACEAMGATGWQRLGWVRLPLAAPVILAGLRTAAVISVGAATLAAFIGAGGLGDPIVTGLALADSRLVLSGTIPAALLAIVVDRVLVFVERVVTPAHLRAAGLRG